MAGTLPPDHPSNIPGTAEYDHRRTPSTDPVSKQGEDEKPADRRMKKDEPAGASASGKEG